MLFSAYEVNQQVFLWTSPYLLLNLLILDNIPYSSPIDSVQHMMYNYRERPTYDGQNNKMKRGDRDEKKRYIRNIGRSKKTDRHKRDYDFQLRKAKKYEHKKKDV